MAKRLYTEANVRDLPAGSELVLGASAIATPAALDLAFQRGIRVRYGGEAPVTVAPGSELWKKIVGGDGSYLVEVKGGRARVFRLESGGPVLIGEGN
jgi:hypothetical protein